MAHDTAALRMLREDWPTATELAEELYAIFSNDKIPITTSVPIQSSAGSTGQPFATLTGYSPGDTIFKIGPNDNSTNITVQQIIDLVGGGGQAPQAASPPAGFAGVVLSGTGNKYSVKLSDGSIVIVTQLQIAAGETIPAGTGAVVFKAGGKFVMQVPVWL